jgi:NAD(P)H-quinone oxidoreductase subunit 5
MTLVVVADSLGLTVVGWEFLGISSTLLIAFFHSRRGPVVNGLRTFTVYRIADVGLLLALMYAHAVFGTTEIGRFIHSSNGPYGAFDGTPWDALVIGLLFLLSASGKSSTLPFFPWLPGAMEGPTPSSAIFYGAFAVHAGPYLFLRQAPLVTASPTLSYILIAVGLISACFASLAGRIRADVKTSLAYATITQVSLIYAEIGLHWFYLAAFHTAGHMCLRTYQFLRAPSALHDLHVRSVLGVASRERGRFYDRIFPLSAQRWLYRLALEQGAILTVYRWLLVRPFLWIAASLNSFEVYCDLMLERLLGGTRTEPIPRPLGASQVVEPRPISES